MTYPHWAATQRLDGMSVGNAALWAMAALVALTAHAGAAWWVMRQPVEEVAIAGAAEVVIDVALLGTAPADQVSAGEALQPVDNTEAEPVEPVETVSPAVTRPVETAPVEPVEPVQPQPVQAQQPVAEAQPIPAIEPSPPSEVQIAAVPPVEAPVEEARPLELVEPVEELVLPEVGPIPVPRPEPKVAEAKPEPKRQEPQKSEAKKKPEKVVEKRPAKPRAGSGGQNRADARKGEADGREAASAATRSAAGNSRQAGNAAASNYPGKVVSKLRRALPRRSSGAGQVLVSFRIAANGGVSNVRISRSSGSAALDKAAMDTVRRAAPFPPIPAAAGRSSWDFDLPLTFRR